MSLIKKIAPVGIDTSIDKVQSKIYDYLTSVSGWADYESYPRAYKNPSDGNVIPEHYTEENEYIELLFDDKFNVTSFFMVDDTATSSGNDQQVFNQSISMIFQAVLPNLFPNVSHRADAEMHDDIFKAFDVISKEITQVVTGVDNVYRDLTLRDQLRSKVNLTDMSDLHVVRFDFDINYSYNECKYNEL